MGTLIFNGVSSEDLGMVIQAPPTYAIPEKDYTVTHISGRNGDIILNDKSYKNVEITYSLACIFQNETSFTTNAEAISTWLHSADGYARLEDSYDPEVFRLAMYKDSAEMQNYYDTVTTIAPVFNCKPQRYYKSGDEYVEITSGQAVINPTGFKAMPFISFTQADNSKESKITFTNGSNVSIFTLSQTLKNDTIYVDCDIMEAYTDTSLVNNKVSLSTEEFLCLDKGTTIITFENIANLKIKTRWWSL